MSTRREVGAQWKPSRRTWHYPRCAGEAIAAYMALSKEGGGEERGGRKEEGAGGRREEEEGGGGGPNLRNPECV